MSEITKLYENAGVKLDCCRYAKYGYEGEEGPWYYCKKEGRECWTYPDGDADCVEKGYPPFTAEKQLELIEFYIKSVWWLNLACFKSSSLPFDEELAKLTNHLWEDMTISQQEQIRSILNG